jgi:hypothetical protein
MYNSFRFLIIACLAAFALAQCAAQPAKIGQSSVWQMPPGFVSDVQVACGKSAGSNCLIQQMAKAGAPDDAVTFTRGLYKQSHGEVGIMTGFQAVGPVDIAWITYPLRANTNYGLLLVNGKPPIVNVEDLKLLDRKTMEQSSQFQNLKAQFIKVDVSPGDRDGKTWPESQAGPNGGTQFVVSYPLRNGCHACAHAGFAIFTWNFDDQGKFLGTSFMGMTPPPLHSAGSDQN